MFLLLLQIILGIVYYVGIPALASVPAIFFFFPAIVWAVTFFFYSVFILVVGILLSK
jgi:hypothetical protein